MRRQSRSKRKRFDRKGKLNKSGPPAVVGPYGSVHRWIGRPGASFMICIQATGRACGKPSSVIRFSTRVAITASTCCAPRLCDRRPPPRTRLGLEKVHSAALRRPYPVAGSHATPPSRATCRAWRPRPVSGSSRAAARTSGALGRNTPAAFGSHCWRSATRQRRVVWHGQRQTKQREDRGDQALGLAQREPLDGAHCACGRDRRVGESAAPGRRRPAGNCIG